MAVFDFSQDNKPDVMKVVEKIGEVSTLPQVLRRVLNVTSDPNAGAAQLQDILQADPALTGKILKVANSAYYGATQKILNVKHAVVFLGFKTVKNLCIAASVCDMFTSDYQIGSYSREELWKHSLMVAICSKAISQRSGINLGEDIFTAGIIHDIGIIMEDQYFHKDFVRVLEAPHLSDLGLTAVEQEVFGFDHAGLGGRVVAKWRIPAEIARTIEYHHKPQSAPEACRKGAAIIYLSNVICNAKRLGSMPVEKADRSDLNFVLEALSFRKEDVAVIVEELPGEIEKASELFII